MIVTVKTTQKWRGIIQTFPWNFEHSLEHIVYLFFVAGSRGFKLMEINSNGCFPGGAFGICHTPPKWFRNHIEILLNFEDTLKKYPKNPPVFIGFYKKIIFLYSGWSNSISPTIHVWKIYLHPRWLALGFLNHQTRCLGPILHRQRGGRRRGCGGLRGQLRRLGGHRGGGAGGIGSLRVGEKTARLRWFSTDPISSNFLGVRW